MAERLQCRGEDLSGALPEVTMKPGVYEIVHLASGKRYVGSAYRIRSRWRGHLRALNSGAKQTSPYLRRAWRKHGPAAFEFRVIVLCEKARLLEIEEHMIRLRCSVARGYNCRTIPHSNAGLKLGPPSAETRRKIGRANAIANKGNPSPMKGQRHTRTARRKMSRTKRQNGTKIIFAGQALTITEWAEQLGTTANALRNRLNRGWPLARVLTEQPCRTADDHHRVMRERYGRKLEFRGRTLCLAEWGRESGLAPDTIRRRIQRGWSVERTITTPSMRGGVQ